MASKNLYFHIILRVLFILFTSVALSYFVLKKEHTFTAYAALLLIFQTLWLIRFLNRTNRKVAYFFNAIENNDSTIRFPHRVQHRSLKALNASLNRVNDLIRDVKMQNREQEQFYQTILEEADIGILTLNEKGHITLSNKTAKKLLNYEYLTHVQQLRQINGQLFRILSEISPFDQKLISMPNEREDVHLTVKATSLTIKGQKLLLVVIQNIRTELDTKEDESWQRLIRVMTHEIMNAVAPITSISETVSGYFTKDNKSITPSRVNENIIGQTIKALDIIQSQGNNLMNFVSSYRSMTGVPHPKKSLLPVPELFESVKLLMSQEKGFAGIEFYTRVSSQDLEVYADRELLILVLMNLVKNAIQSLEEQAGGMIRLTGKQDRSGKVVLSVADSGPGIAQDIMEEIFVPFFTTKKKGSGIGLSLSKHIMKLHGGSIEVRSFPGHETIFSLVFPYKYL